MSIPRSRIRQIDGYLMGLVLGLAGIAARAAMGFLVGKHNFYLVAFVAIFFTAWKYGLGPSIIAAVTSVAGVWFWFLHETPVSELSRTDIASAVGFLLFSIIVTVVAESTRRTRKRQEETEQALRAAQANLKLALEQMGERIRQRTSELEQKTVQLEEQAKLLDLDNDAIFVQTARHRLSYWNKGAERLYGWPKEEALGALSYELLRTEFPLPLETIERHDRWEGELIQKRRDGSQITVASRWTALRDHEGKFKGWLEINTDITAKKRAEEAARRLSARILSLQDDERRRIARELHDSLGQYLVSLKVNMDLLGRLADSEQEQALVAQCRNIIDHSLTETRTISHLLHPPLLDEAGFASAARWYVEGFAERSGVETALELPEEGVRLGRDVETALFRVLQESLTNVHRHSGGTRVRIALRLDAEFAELEIADNGCGIPEERLRRMGEDQAATGVGLAGMRERVRELGGSLSIENVNPGISVKAMLPFAQQSTEAVTFDVVDSSHGASAA